MVPQEIKRCKNRERTLDGMKIQLFVEDGDFQIECEWETSISSEGTLEKSVKPCGGQTHSVRARLESSLSYMALFLSVLMSSGKT